MIVLNETFTSGSVVSYTCCGEYSNSDVATSVCTEEGIWAPDPLNFTCKNNTSTKGTPTYHNIATAGFIFSIHSQH